MAKLDPQTYLLCIAMSRNQQRYYQDLLEQLPAAGEVLVAKHPGWASPLAAMRWVRRQGLVLGDWLGFKLDKAGENQEVGGALYRGFLRLRVLHFLAAVMKRIAARRPSALVLLNGAHYKQQAAIAYARAQDIPVIYLELGCLPNTLAVDGKGVNYNNSLPRDPAFYRAYQPQGEGLPRELIRRPPRTPVGEPVALPDKFIFVPFQVYDDTQILLQSPWIRSMEQLYQLLVDSVDLLPQGWRFVVKEHPTAKRSYEHLYDRHPGILFANANDTQELIERAQVVVTINSTVGIESLMLGTPVITLGNAFYNIEGLVQHANNREDFHRLLERNRFGCDEKLVKQFIAYLHEQYLVPGRPKNTSPEHFEGMRRRIAEILLEGRSGV